MDEFLFSDYLERCRSSAETTSFLEILNYSDHELNSFKKESLALADDFGNFLTRKGVYAPIEPKNGATFRDGIRLVLQHNITDKRTFSPDVISLSKDTYKSLVRDMHLPLRGIQTTSVVGPFFWWDYDLDAADPCLQIIFRKSDVEREKESRGFEMMLSHSFQTRITSGYFKGTNTANIEAVLEQLRVCACRASHPLLLPILVLTSLLSGENDEQQREIRGKLRELEKALSRRYKKSGEESGENPDEESGEISDKINWELDKINCKLAEWQCQAMCKRPQAWQNVVDRIRKAAECFWTELPEESKVPELRKLNRELSCSLDFLTIKLEGLENYAHVSQERLNLQRQVMDSIINLRESRINLKVAAQQSRLAEVSKRDSSSMKTLALLGSFFLPGTFLSSIFSMSFFNFDSDMNGSVSSRLWIYFVIMAPLTAITMGAWWMFDRHSNNEMEEDEQEVEVRMDDIEAQAMHRIRRRTGTRAF